MRDFFVFRRMITPVLIQIVFWVMTVLVILSGLAAVIGGEGSGERVIGLFTLVLGPIVVRLYAEIFIIIFRMNETLTDIKSNTGRGQGQLAGSSSGPFCASCGESVPQDAQFCPHCGRGT